MKIAIILGTRPEIIKMSPVIKEFDARGIAYFIIHTGQHYDYQMDQKFFEDLELKAPDYNLNAGGKEYRIQLSLMVNKIEKILYEKMPDVVLVQGDTNSVLAGALAAKKLGIKIGHLEAGLRSKDMAMLEEVNRIITDQISDFLFAPTEEALKNLKEEGLGDERAILTGNTIVDAVFQSMEIANKKCDVLKKYNLEKKGYVVVTAHRAENVDSEKRLKGILDGLNLVGQQLELPIIYPIHPRTVNNMKKYGFGAPENVRLIKPLGYLEFLQLEANAKLIMTDSGGLQEEACILKVPCVTVRDNTERPETIEAGINILAGTEPDKILDCTKNILNNASREYGSLFGDGSAGKRIVDFLAVNLK